MRITDEQGLYNNFASEPEVYFAEPPTNSEKTRYAIQAVFSAALIGVIAYIAYIAS